MKKLMTWFALALLVCTGAAAQRADLRKVAEKYKDASTLTASVTQTRHNEALAKDAVAKGYFYYRKPNTLSMVFKEAGEMLLAKDNTFTMVRNGKQHVAKAKGKGNNPFEILGDMLRNLLSADDDAPLTDMADVKLEKQGSTCTITVTPTAPDAKARRRSMFTSCVVSVDLKAAELRSLRINEQGGNYTHYDFAGFRLNAEVDGSAFDTQTVM